jgi:hypothetical protein
LGIGLNEHRSGVVYKKSCFHYVHIMIDYLFLLKFEDVSASADALELWKVVDTSVSELEIVWFN